MWRGGVLGVGGAVQVGRGGVLGGLLRCGGEECWGGGAVEVWRGGVLGGEGGGLLRCGGEECWGGGGGAGGVWLLRFPINSQLAYRTDTSR